MPFIPNFADAAFADQAEPDSIDFQILLAGHRGDGVLSGCAVTAQGTPDMTLAVAAGSVQIGGAAVAVTGGNVTITAADGTNARVDLVTVNSSGVKSVTAGTAAVNPAMPALPANSVVLAAVFVPANDTAIGATQITDKRVTVTPANMVATVAGNTAGALAAISTGTVQFAGGNNLTISQNANSLTFSGPNTSAQQTGISGWGNSETIYTSGTVRMSGLGPITIRSTTGNAFQLSVSPIVGISNSETTFTSGTVGLSVVGGPATIRSTTGNAFQLSIANSHAQQTGISGISNSQTQYTSGTVNLSGLGAVVVRSTTGNAFEISAPTAIGAIANSETTYTSGTVGLSGLANITIRSTTGNQLQFSVPAAGAGPSGSFWANIVPNGSVQPLASLAISTQTVLIQPLAPVEGFLFPQAMTASTAMVKVSLASNTGATASSAAFSSTVRLGIYTMNGSTLSLLNSASATIGQAASTNNSLRVNGQRWITFHSTDWSVQPAFDVSRYWFGIMFQTGGVSGNSNQMLGQYLAGSTQMSGTFGNSSATATTQAHLPFLGIYSANTAALPVSIRQTDINAANVMAGFSPMLVFNNIQASF